MKRTKQSTFAKRERSEKATGFTPVGSEDMTQPAKHTPGPWTLERDRAKSLSICVGSTFVGEVYNEVDKPSAQENANAHLIAAAPAMYADGKVLCGLVRDFMNDNRLYDGQVIQAIHNLETALAQAEGK